MALTRAEHVLLAVRAPVGADRRPAPGAVGVPGGGRAARSRRRGWAASSTGRRNRSTARANPATAEPVTAEWPVDPLGARSAAVHAGAELVREALQEQAAAERRVPGRVRAPGRGRARRTRRSGEPDAEADPATPRAGPPTSTCSSPSAPPPASAPSSRCPRSCRSAGSSSSPRDPAALAARLRRPLPLPPNPHARRGTAFHAWLEQRFGAAQLLDVDELPGAADEGAASDDLLEELQEAFLASRWARARAVRGGGAVRDGDRRDRRARADGRGVRRRGRRLDGRRLEDRRAARSRPAGRAERAARRVPAGLGRAGRLPAGAGAGGRSTTCATT